MSALNETIVKEYFELLGFFVHQPRKYQVVARPKQSEEEIDLLVFNPNPAPVEPPDTMLWGAAELRGVTRAIIGIKAWHSGRFSSALLETTPDILKFAEPSVLSAVHREIGEGPVTRILCMADLPASKALRREALEVIRNRGIDGVLLFRTLLLELAERVDDQKTYDKSDFLQTLRILKNYDLLKDAQMDLFRKKARKGSAE